MKFWFLIIFKNECKCLLIGFFWLFFIMFFGVGLLVFFGWFIIVMVLVGIVIGVGLIVKFDMYMLGFGICYFVFSWIIG